jgi:MFS superfamily sulfate permease-like transporter
MPLLGRQRGSQVFRDLDENPADETFPGIAVLRMDGGLLFATAEALEQRTTRPGRSPTSTASRATSCWRAPATGCGCAS